MGKDGYPGHQHDPARRQQILPMAQRQDRPVLSPADRGRVGIRLPRRHDHRLFLRRRRQRNSATTPGSATTATSNIKRSARKSRIRGASTTCTATSPNGCLDQYDPDYYKQFADTVAPIPGTRPPSLIRTSSAAVHGMRRCRPSSQRRPPRLRPRVENAGPAIAQEHLVFYRRAIRRLPHRAPAQSADAPRKCRNIGTAA